MPSASELARREEYEKPEGYVEPVDTRAKLVEELARVIKERAELFGWWNKAGTRFTEKGRDRALEFMLGASVALTVSDKKLADSTVGLIFLCAVRGTDEVLKIKR